jgi:hypothetical protein
MGSDPFMTPGVFTTENTGHSGEFVHSLVQAKAYWKQLTDDIKP